MEQITRWLAGSRNYQEGVALYEQYGTSTALKRMFAQGEYSFSRDKLRHALQDLLEQGIPASPTGPAAVAAPSPVVEKPKPAPDFVTMVREKMRPLLDQRTMLHARLTIYDELGLTQPQIKEIASQIKKLTRQITPLYLQLKNGPAAAVPEEAPVDFSKLSGVQQVQLRCNLRSQRTKIKNNPARQHELPALEAKIEQLSKLIEAQKND